jgi:hypothetical protein
MIAYSPTEDKMEARTWFAGIALLGYILREPQGYDLTHDQRLAQRAWSLADAMLDERDLTTRADQR